VSHLQATLIANLATVRSGAGAPQDPSAFSHDGHPFIRAGSLSRLLDGDDENQLEKIRPDTARAHRLQLFPKGTVLFAKSGMSATKGYIYSLKQPAYIVSHLAALVPHDSRDSAFLVRALQHFPPTSLIKDQAYPSIRLGDIEQMEILAPASIDDRGRIAAILDKADALRRKRKRALDLLDNLTQSIFVEMFGDPLVNPKSWPRRRIGEVCKVITGNTPPRSVASYYGCTIEWIKSDNIDPDEPYVTEAAEFLSDQGKAVARIAPAGSTLVTCIAGSPNSIGNASMTNREVAFNQQINALVPMRLEPLFLNFQIKVGKRLVQEASTGGMKGLVSKSRLENVLLMYPPSNLLCSNCAIGRTSLKRSPSSPRSNPSFSADDVSDRDRHVPPDSTCPDAATRILAVCLARNHG
jgi:type I restriction enzyme S subunit